MNIKTGNIIKWTDVFDQEQTSEILELYNLSASNTPMYVVVIRDLKHNIRRNYYLEDLEKGAKEIYQNIEELEEGDIVEVMYNEGADKLLIYAIKKGNNHFEDIVYIGEEGNAVPSTQTFKLEKNYTYVRFIQSTISPLSIVKGLLPEYFI